MAVLPIITIGHPLLRQVARQVERAELASAAVQSFIDDLILTMRQAHGAGLAAIQVAEPVQICVIEVCNNARYPYKPNVPLTVLVNPKLTALTAEEFENYEGCLSVPNLRGRVKRFAEIHVSALDRFGNAIETDIRGLTAGTYQHEVDHLNGILFVDRVFDPRTLTTLENFSAYEIERFAAEAKALVARFGA